MHVYVSSRSAVEKAAGIAINAIRNMGVGSNQTYLYRSNMSDCFLCPRPVGAHTTGMSISLGSGKKHAQSPNCQSKG